MQKYNQLIQVGRGHGALEHFLYACSRKMTYNHSQRWVRSVFLSLKLQKATCGRVCSNLAECTVRRHWHVLWLQFSCPVSPTSEGGSGAVLSGPCPSTFLPGLANGICTLQVSQRMDAGITQNTGRWGRLCSKSGPLCGCERSVGWWAWLKGQGRTFANIDGVQLARWVLLCRISFFLF